MDVSVRVQPGESVFAIGYPLGERLGLEPSIVNGLVNAVVGPNDDPTLFRLSAPLNPGNSGGPIVNSRGEVVGVAVSALRGKLIEGIAFGIKIATATPILGDLTPGLTRLPKEPIPPERIFGLVSPWVVRVISQ